MSEKSLIPWDKFIETGEISIGSVNPVIGRSWQRSQQYKVNPHNIEENEILTVADLRSLAEKNWHLINAATPIMENLYQALRGMGFTVVLTDNQGYILRCITNEQFKKHAKQVMLCEGVNWAERFKGTNAIGTSIAEKKPVKVFASEHYVKQNHSIACAAVPIIGGDGDIVGALDVTGHGDKGNDQLLYMVKMAAHNIERELQIQKLQKKLNMHSAQYKSVLELVKEGIIIVDDTGTIQEINPTAEKILGAKTEKCMGENIKEMFNLNNMWVMDSTVQDSKEITISTQNNPSLIDARIKRLQTCDGDSHGMIALISSPDGKALSGKGNKSDNLTETSNIVRYTFDQIVGKSKYLQQAISICKRVATNDSTVLLYGETGTGKEMLAQAIHQESTRRDGPFVAINCGAIPAELIESELFGYEEGAFTGARKGGNLGKFEVADGGTIFLDEIGDMPLRAQVSLLRVLQEKQLSRVGGSNIRPIDVRVIAATHRDLFEMVQNGEFRQDLFFRLNVVNVCIPPLRSRKEDIGLLVEVFMGKYKTKFDRPNIELSQETLEYLEKYRWVGNVRQLENVIEGIVNMAEGNEVTPADLPKFILEDIEGDDSGGSPQTLKDIEKEAIKQAIIDCEGNLKAAAFQLDIGRSTLYRKLKEYNIEAV